MTISASANQTYSRTRRPLPSTMPSTPKRARSANPEKANGWRCGPELLSRCLHMRLRHVAERNVQIAQNTVHFLLGLQFLCFAHQLARQVGCKQLDELIHVGAQERAAAEPDPSRMSLEQVARVEYHQICVGRGI